MFGFVVNPGRATHPRFRKNPTLPHQGLVWQCRVTRRCRVRVWFGVGLGVPVSGLRVMIKTAALLSNKVYGFQEPNLTV
ncbi:MAG: hypothetical protein ACK5F1_01535 [Burkholderiales bacterium]